MAVIIDFPSLADREWSVWERAIKEACRGTIYDHKVVDTALVQLKEHWSILFKPVTLELKPRPIPAPLTAEQASAIQSLVDSGAQVVVEHLKEVRTVALGRLVQVELTLAYIKANGYPS
jgi:hypothetical protein